MIFLLFFASSLIVILPVVLGGVILDLPRRRWMHQHRHEIRRDVETQREADLRLNPYADRRHDDRGINQPGRPPPFASAPT